MTDFDPSARDELVSAYLDGEATPAERARVEADPELLERVEIHRRVADLVGGRVTPPADELRRTQIAAALDASDTADNVTALVARRRRWEAAKVVSIAAMVVAALALPIVLFGNGESDDDEATSLVEADDAAADDDAAAEPDAARGEVASEPAAAPEPEPEPEQEAMLSTEADEATGGDTDAAGDDAAADDSLAEEAQDGAMFRLSLFFDAEPLDLEIVPDIDALIEEVLAFLTSGRTAPGTGSEAIPLSELVCLEAWLDLTADRIDVAEVMVVGTAVVDRELVEYIAADTDDGVVLVALAVQGCEPVADEIIAE